MAYTLTGEFFEVCDCEAVCSCWIEVDPAMGSCTGLFAWFIDSGSVDGVDVSGCKVMLLFNGSSCDQASHLMLLVDGSTPAMKNAVRNALTADGPWAQVVKLAQGVDMPPLVPAAIKATPANRTGKKVSLSAKATKILAEAYCEIGDYELRGPVGSLIDRSTGTAASKSIKAGSVVTDTASGTGLNLLATNTLPLPPYTFDVDITDVSAVRGKFSYSLP
jgi:hypothetical protein